MVLRTFAGLLIKSNNCNQHSDPDTKAFYSLTCYPPFSSTKFRDVNCEARLGLIDGKGLQLKSSELSKYISFNQQKHDCDSDIGLGGSKLRIF